MRGAAGRPSAASAARSARRSRGRLPAPRKAARNRPSGRSARRIWISAPGKSLTVSSAPAETIRSNEAAAKGRRSSSPSERGHPQAALPQPLAEMAAAEIERVGKGPRHQIEPRDQLVGHMAEQIARAAARRAVAAQPPQAAVERSVGVHPAAIAKRPLADRPAVRFRTRCAAPLFWRALARLLRLWTYLRLALPGLPDKSR